MIFIRKYIVAVIAGVLILLLVVLRLSGWNRFTKSAGDLNTGTLNQANIILLANNKENLPVIDIRKDGVYAIGHPEGAINITFDNLLSVECRKVLKKSKKGVILFSDDFAMLSRGWTILNQMGYKNVFIAGDGIEKDELLKFEFVRDSTVGGK